MSDLKGGDEIFNHYGDRKNAHFFLNNGFVYEEHPNDTLRLKIGLSTADPLYALKEALCKKIDISPLGVFELAAKTAPANKQLLAFIRIFLLDKGLNWKIGETELWSDNFPSPLQSNWKSGIHVMIRKSCLTKTAKRCTVWPTR